MQISLSEETPCNNSKLPHFLHFTSTSLSTSTPLNKSLSHLLHRYSLYAAGIIVSVFPWYAKCKPESTEFFSFKCQAHKCILWISMSLNKEHFEILRKRIEGDIHTDKETLRSRSRDTSIFTITPEIVIFPKTKQDIEQVVAFVNTYKEIYPSLSITARGAGTCMSGGPLNNSIILDFTRYLNKIISIRDKEITVEPGCFYRDFEKETLKYNLILPSYTASKEICTVGGMVNNNSAGEKTMRYGKTEKYVKRLSVVFHDGNTCEVKPLTKLELEQKMNLETEEGVVYKKLFDLITKNYEDIQRAKPQVSKNSAGYSLWNVWDNEDTFDLCQLIIGAQGTLGIVTEITFELVPLEKENGVIAVFLPSLDHLGDIVKEITPLFPDSLESYDDYSMKLAVRFFFDFFTYLGFKETIKLGMRFLPEFKMLLTGGIPKLTLLVEFSEKDTVSVSNKIEQVTEIAKKYNFKIHVAKDKKEAEKYWRIRRESFNMLRKHMSGKRTAPFIDDIIVPPEVMPEFLPKLQNLLTEYNLTYTIAGHAGNGNFHIIPLLDFKNTDTKKLIIELSKKVYDLVISYKGSITAEHNDGIIRTPFLPQMFGEDVCVLFQETKNIFDPKNILNPGKKVGGTFEQIESFMRTDNN